MRNPTFRSITPKVRPRRFAVVRASLLPAAVLLLCHAALTAIGATDNDLAVLATGYFRYKLADQVSREAEKFAGSLREQDAPQVRKTVADWHTQRMGDLRASLSGRFGDNAAVRFESFWIEFERMEQTNDLPYLASIVKALDLPNVPATYVELRREMASLVAPDLQSASALLSEVQTWGDLRARDASTPSLEIWMTRSKPAKTPIPPAPQPKPAGLDAAEAGVGAFVAPAAQEDAPLDAFKTTRDDRRQKALDEAKAGMQQVASERQAAEADYAARKAAEAQAEVEGLKRHADKLAAAEQTAYEQRQNSFANRLKNVLAATVSAATGAFTGGLGSRAGQAAVDAIFGSPSPPPRYAPPQVILPPPPGVPPPRSAQPAQNVSPAGP